MEVSTIGLDLAKHVFQAHGADASGAVVFRKRLRRGQVLAFFAGSRRAWWPWRPAPARTIGRASSASSATAVRLLPPAYVKPFVKRQKNDAADAEAICEAAQRPTMRFVAVKSEEQQASAVVFRARDLLVRQRTQTINALRGHLAEFGIVAAKGPFHVGKLIAAIEDRRSALPAAARQVLDVLVELLRSLDENVALLDGEIARRGCGSQAADDDPGNRPDHGDSSCRIGAAGTDLQERTRLCGLAGSHAVATLHGWEAETRSDDKDGRANPAPPACHRGKCCRATGTALNSG